MQLCACVAVGYFVCLILWLLLREELSLRVGNLAACKHAEWNIQARVRLLLEEQKAEGDEDWDSLRGGQRLF